jgi:uncharacterized protein YndB with AHSA1/START domain
MEIAAMVKATLFVLGLLILIVAVAAAIGYALPVAHVASREVVVPRAPEQVFAALGDVDKYPAWRSDVRRVEVLSGPPRTRWREHGSNGTIAFEFEDVQPPARLVSRIADRSLPFGGRWTYVLTPDGSGTKVSITEHGEVYNPLFRFMSRFVFGHTATMDTFLGDLSKHLRAQ